MGFWFKDGKGPEGLSNGELRKERNKNDSKRQNPFLNHGTHVRANSRYNQANNELNNRRKGGRA